LTFNPGVNSAKVSVGFEEFNLESNTYCNFDWLKIFDGPTTSSQLIGIYCGTNSPGRVIATNQDGALTFQFHSDYSETRPGWKAKVSCRMDQTLNMSAGWNGISTFIRPDDPGFEEFFSDILDELVILQNDDGIFWPDQNINTLGVWETSVGYQVKLKNDVVLNIPGTVTSDYKTELKAGWNCLPVISQCPVNMEDLLAGSGTQIIFVMEVAGTGIFWPEMGISSLEQLQPGKSYYLKSAGGGLITFPVCD
jgi:hypothetical protein